MRYILLAAAAAALIQPASAQLAREGKITSTLILGGSIEQIAMPPVGVHANWKAHGTVAETQGFFAGASFRCMGTYSVKGASVTNAGMCEQTHSDGGVSVISFDQTGSPGQPSSGTWTFVGGTGRYAGVTGGGRSTTRSAPPPQPGLFVTINSTEGAYRLAQ